MKNLIVLRNLNIHLGVRIMQTNTQKMKFSIKDFFSKCDQICSFSRIWSHFLKKYLMEKTPVLRSRSFKIWLKTQIISLRLNLLVLIKKSFVYLRERTFLLELSNGLNFLRYEATFAKNLFFSNLVFDIQNTKNTLKWLRFISTCKTLSPPIFSRKNSTFRLISAALEITRKVYLQAKGLASTINVLVVQ